MSKGDVTLVKFKPVEGGIMVTHGANEVYIGEIETIETGESVFWPTKGEGFWEWHILEAIADTLKSLNSHIYKDWEEYFKAKGYEIE